MAKDVCDYAADYRRSPVALQHADFTETAMDVSYHGIDHAKLQTVDALQFALRPFHGDKDAALVSMLSKQATQVYLRIDVPINVCEKARKLL